jgi:uncharacterized protein
MNTYDIEKAKQYILQRQKELSPGLYYHGPTHTSEDVVPAVITFAKSEGISGEKFDLVVTAAWFHDIGFIEMRIGHETVSARIAEEMLPGFGYSAEQIKIIKSIILATIVPQNPKTLLEQIIADADLDVLGRNRDFMTRNLDLRREISYFGKDFTDEEWFTSQYKFVSTHTYFTKTAHAMRDETQKKNVAELKNILDEILSKK